MSTLRIITRVAVTLRDVYKVPRTEIAAAMKGCSMTSMVDEPHRCRPVAIKLFGKTHMDFTDCLLAARTAIYNDDVVSFGKPIIQGMIDYRRKRQTAAETRSRDRTPADTAPTPNRHLRHHGRHNPPPPPPLTLSSIVVKYGLFHAFKGPDSPYFTANLLKVDCERISLSGVGRRVLLFECCNLRIMALNDSTS